MPDTPKWQSLISQPQHAVTAERDVFIPVRDGTQLAADVHRPAAAERFPALLAFQPWGKDHDAFGRAFPSQRRPSPLWDGALEGGDTEYLVSRGYAHVIVDARGTGASGGELTSVMGAGTSSEGPDLHDTVEWIAGQPWCNGNVGMIGISYLAAVQLLAAAENPPHLKAVFPEGGHYDVYRHMYHGGILWKMPRAAMRGRGGDSGLAVANPVSAVLGQLTGEEQRKLIDARLGDPDVGFYPNYHQLLRYPYIDPIWLDYILSPVDGPFYWGAGRSDERLAKVKIPVHLGVQLGRGWQVEETINAFTRVNGFRQLVLRPGPPMQERPFHEFHDEIVRWYDHWLKGNDTGILDEPPVRVFVEGVNEWRSSDQWPLPCTTHKTFYLRPNHRLLGDPETLPAAAAPPDGFYQAPERVCQKVNTLEYLTDGFTEPVDFIGGGGLHLHAEIDTQDTNWIITLYDVAPNGDRTAFTTGYLKASHRELDSQRSTEAAPFHPHSRIIPVPVNEVIEYSISIYPCSRRIDISHRLLLEIKSLESEQSVNQMLPPESGHLNSGWATTHKIYRDRRHRSHLVLSVAPPAGH